MRVARKFILSPRNEWRGDRGDGRVSMNEFLYTISCQSTLYFICFVWVFFLAANSKHCASVKKIVNARIVCVHSTQSLKLIGIFALWFFDRAAERPRVDCWAAACYYYYACHECVCVWHTFMLTACVYVQPSVTPKTPRHTLVLCSVYDTHKMLIKTHWPPLTRQTHTHKLSFMFAIKSL